MKIIRDMLILSTIVLLWTIGTPVLIHMVNGVDDTVGCSGNNKGLPSFTGSKLLNQQDGYKVSWLIKDSELYLQLEMNASNGLGFMGFGLGEETSGSMLGGDIVTVRINNGKLIVEDRNVPFDSYPIDNYSPSFPSLDHCQDWQPVSVEMKSNSWSAIVKRKLKTNDHQDRDIFPHGAQRVIYAWSIGAENVEYHGEHRGATSVDFSTNAPQDVPIPTDAAVELNLTMGAYKIQTKSDTYYICKGFDIAKLVDIKNKDRHIVRIEPLIQPGNEKYVHHMLLHDCGNIPAMPFILHPPVAKAAICKRQGWGTSPLGAGSCRTILYGWAVGSKAMLIPDGVGMRISKNKGGYSSRYLILEIHYDNKALIKNLVDSSGVRLHITADDKQRKEDAAGFSLGLFGDPSDLQANVNPQHRETTCHAECTNSLLGPINIFGSFLHMHSYGKQIWTSLYEGADIKKKKIINRIDFWNFKYQQTTHVNFTINRGDQLSTHAIFDLTQSNTPVKFGEKSSEEMLYNFMFGYPAKNMNGIFSCGTIMPYAVALCGNNPILLSSPLPDGDTFLPPIFGVKEDTCSIGTEAPSSIICSNNSSVDH